MRLGYLSKRAPLWVTVILVSVLSLMIPSPVVAAATLPPSTVSACSQQPHSGKPKLNVSSYNVGKGDEPKKGPKIAEFFKMYDFDIMGIQEAYPYGEHKEFELAEDVKREVNKLFPGKQLYFFSHMQETDHALLIISKFPILDQSYVDIPGGRSVIQTLLDTPYGKLRFFNTHFQRKEDAAMPGLNAAMDFIVDKTKLSEPFILVGDYNLEKPLILSNPRANELFKTDCTNTGLCFMGGIDFLFPSKKNGPILENVCAYWHAFIDAHELYLATFDMTGTKGSASGDLNKDGVVDIFDYNLLLGSMYTNKCEYKLVRSNPNDCLISIFDYNEMIGILKKS